MGLKTVMCLRCGLQMKSRRFGRGENVCPKCGGQMELLPPSEEAARKKAESSRKAAATREAAREDQKAKRKAEVLKQQSEDEEESKPSCRACGLRAFEFMEKCWLCKVKDEEVARKKAEEEATRKAEETSSSTKSEAKRKAEEVSSKKDEWTPQLSTGSSKDKKYRAGSYNLLEL